MELFVSMLDPIPTLALVFFFLRKKKTGGQRLRVSDPGNLLVLRFGGWEAIPRNSAWESPHIHVRQLGIYLRMWMTLPW